MFEKKDEKFIIKREANNYFELDEFAFLLDQIIRQYNNNPVPTNIKKLNFFIKYNPYCKEPNYFNKVGSLDLEQIDSDIIKDFNRTNFECIFKDKILEYIQKFIGKIKNIPNFDNVIQLINIKNIENKNIYLYLLNKRYDNIISNTIGLLANEKIKEAVHVITKIAIINYA